MRHMYKEEEILNSVCLEYSSLELLKCLVDIVSQSSDHKRNVVAIGEMANLLEMQTLRLSGIEKAVQWMKLNFEK